MKGCKGWNKKITKIWWRKNEERGKTDEFLTLTVVVIVVVVFFRLIRKNELVSSRKVSRDVKEDGKKMVEKKNELSLQR